jgi:16S rRNA (cytosine967-C5)-methyltransferase
VQTTHDLKVVLETLMSEKEQAITKSMPRGFQSRKLALDVLLKVNEGGAYSNITLSQALQNCQLSRRDKAFVTLLVQGVTRNLGAVDDVVKRFSKTPLKKLPAVLLNTLRLGVYQLEYLQDTPPSAVLNTSTAVAKACGHKGMASYTTAVLRSYLRAREAEGVAGFISNKESETTFESVDAEDADAERQGGLNVAVLAQKYSLPEWLVSRWVKNYSEEEALCLIKYSTSAPRIVLRTNELKQTVEELSSTLRGAGVEFEISPLVPSCLVLSSRGRGRGSPSELPGYAEGNFSIQDDTAAFVAKVLDPKPGDCIIDLCAAPGGKALFIGELMGNKGRIIAVDTRANRLDLLKTNRRRLGIMNIEIFEADGTTFEFEPLVDRIIVDAPCSGTGVLNRRADLRHKRKEEDIENLATLQYNLLANAQKLLKPGGVIVYATCTVEPEENERVIDKFLSNHSNFDLEDLNPFFPREIVEEHGLAEVLRTGKVQILPTIKGLSGFYIARLKKADEISEPQSDLSSSDG